MNQLEPLSERIRADLEARDRAREEALRNSRQLTQTCAVAIRSIHRNEWEAARQLLEQASSIAARIRGSLDPYPELLFAGYAQDALKELVEAHITLALVSGTAVPDSETLGVAHPAYLNGLCEAASELRRRCLDELRRGNSAEAERLLETMDDVFDILVTFDFPDAITGGLRHRVDQLRGVLERTRGDLTNSLSQNRLLLALQGFEERTKGG